MTTGSDSEQVIEVALGPSYSLFPPVPVNWSVKFSFQYQSGAATRSYAKVKDPLCVLV